MKSTPVGFTLLVTLVSMGLTACTKSESRGIAGFQSLQATAVSGDCQVLKTKTSSPAWRLTASKADPSAEVTFTPVDTQAWDLSRSAAIRMNVRNTGDAPVTVRARITNESANALAATCQTAANLLPGEASEMSLLIVPTPPDPGYKPFAKFYKYFDSINVRDNTVDPSTINALTVWLDAPAAAATVEITALRLDGVASPRPESFFPFIDKYGQYIHADWPGKIYSDADFAVRRAEEEKERKEWPGPTARSKFGGWASGPRLKATGNFYPTKHEGKWWLVDPEGRLFWSYGPTGAGFKSEPSAITDRESWFAQLPPRTGPTSKYYTSHKGAPSEYYRDREWVGFLFSPANVELKYGPNAASELTRITTERLRSWGFNTLGNWSQTEVMESGRIPYVTAIHYGAPMIDDHMPDVYAPQWEDNLRTRLEKERDRTAKDPWNIGYFVDNERRWGKFARAAGVALKTLECPPTSPAKIAFMKDLQSKYGTIDKLNDSWGTKHASWESLANHREPVSFEKPRNANLQTDCGDFGEKFAERYFSTCRRLVKHVAPNHLYLGARLNGHIDRSLIQLQTKYCDVISYNMYDRSPDGRMKMYEGIDFPFMVTEWGVDNDHRQSPFRASKVEVAIGRKGERRDLLVEFAEAAIVHPKLVGAHFFQYRDQPISGRSDGEGLLRGFVNITDTPNFELVQANRKLAYDLYQKRARSSSSQ